ncbi:unnamed protein product [Diatraea saccharalis]|uniref:MADF domain-containing protein n=1 Tax=Diatraea saccharalis TaxID=40085 RepID=A0A9N9RBB2_9NEOP|nr:unnamed protein product [Diatraea saccharalis]
MVKLMGGAYISEYDNCTTEQEEFELMDENEESEEQSTEEEQALYLDSRLNVILSPEQCQKARTLLKQVYMQINILKERDSLSSNPELVDTELDTDNPMPSTSSTNYPAIEAMLQSKQKMRGNVVKSRSIDLCSHDLCHNARINLEDDILRHWQNMATTSSEVAGIANTVLGAPATQVSDSLNESENTVTLNETTEKVFPTPKTFRKRRRPQEENDTTQQEALKILQSMHETRKSKDESDAFGDCRTWVSQGRRFWNDDGGNMVPWDVDPEALIIEVESRTFLYAKALPDYSNKIVKNNAWESITKNLSEDWEALTNEEKNSRSKTCRDRWRRIRDNYRRAKKLRKTKSGQAATNMKKPKYEDLLSFLIPYISNEDETFSNFPPNYIFQDSSNEDNSLLDDIHSRDSPSSSAGTSQSTIRNRPGSSEDSSPRAYKRNPRTLDIPPQLSPTHSLLQEYLEKKYSTKKNESDKIVEFFKNLGETVSNFPEDVQIRVKREVFKIVTDAEEFVFREKSKPQYVLELSQESAPPIIVVNSNDVDAQPRNQKITPTSTNVNPNDIDTQEEIGLDLDDNALNAFLNSVQQKNNNQ